MRALTTAARGIHLHRQAAAIHRMDASLSRTRLGRLWHLFRAAGHDGEALRCEALVEALRDPGQ